MNKPLTVKELALIRIQKPAKVKSKTLDNGTLDLGRPLLLNRKGERIAEILKKWRIEQDITLTQAAVVTGLSRGYLHKLEQGFRGYRPSARALHRLAKLMPELKAFER